VLASENNKKRKVREMAQADRGRATPVFQGAKWELNRARR